MKSLVSGTKMLHALNGLPYQRVPSATWKELKIQQEFLQKLGESLGYKNAEDFYQISRNEIKNFGGKGLLRIYNNSAIDVVMNVFPTVEWKKWKFHEEKPSGYWKDLKNQRDFFDDLAKKLKIEKQEDWYSVQSKQISQNGGAGLLNRYTNSPYKALKTVYPEFDWKPWMFSQVSRGFWENEQNVLEGLKWLEKKLDIQKWEDWYTVNSKHLHNLGFSTLISKYDGNIFQMLRKHFPEHPWDVNYQVPDLLRSNFVKDSLNELFPSETILFNYFLPDPQLSKYKFDYFIQKLNLAFDVLSESKTIDEEKIQKAKEVGINLINIPHWWDLSLSSLKATIHRHRPDLFKDFADVEPIKDHVLSVEKKYPKTELSKPMWLWKELRTHREFFDQLAEKLQIKHWTDWYEVNSPQIIENGGSGLLMLYNSSPVKALMSIYPEHPWKPWKFGRLPTGFWDSDSNALEALHWVADEKNIHSVDDWFKITSADLDGMGLSGLREKYGGLISILKKFYPQYEWNPQSSRGTDITLSKSHQILFKITQELFPEVPNIHVNYPHPELKYDDTKNNLELDIFIPSLSLALEFHGKQHYHYHYMFGTPEVVKSRDLEKKLKCISAGITLIEVPYWWNRTKESLAATIKSMRSDLLENFQTSEPPIPTYAPSQS